MTIIYYVLIEMRLVYVDCIGGLLFSTDNSNMFLNSLLNGKHVRRRQE